MKTYMIVTNDKYELPVRADLVGAQQVADYLGLTVNRVRKNICTGIWNHRQQYKAVVVGNAEGSIEERRRAYNKRYSMSHDRSEYYRQYYKAKKERIKNEQVQCG